MPFILHLTGKSVQQLRRCVYVKGKAFETNTTCLIYCICKKVQCKSFTIFSSSVTLHGISSSKGYFLEAVLKNTTKQK